MLGLKPVNFGRGLREETQFSPNNYSLQLLQDFLELIL
jgi:hypothetical protein